MKSIHPTAVINPAAELGENISIGPYAIIEADVVIGDDCQIGPHAAIYNGARIGNRVKIFQSASVSNLPQDLKFSQEKTYFYIGDDTTIREFATLHRGTVDSGKTSLGKNCLIMAYGHVAHDCFVGDNCILANCVQLGGHANLGDWVIVGGSTPVHQFSTIGQHAMIGGGFRVTVDIPPYVLAASEPLKFTGLNSIGLKRRGFSDEDIAILKKAYNILYLSGLNLKQGRQELETEFPDHPLVQNIIKFLSESTRPVLKR